MTTEQKDGSILIDSNNDSQPIEIQSSDGEVTLRQFSLEDAEELFALIDSSREHLSQHDDETASKYPDIESIRDSIKTPANPQRLRFGIRNKDGVLVGSINLTPKKDDPVVGEVGYYLGASHTGHGYTTSALRALTDYAFDTLGYEKLFGQVAEANVPSIKVLQKVGYEERKREDGEVYLYKDKPNPVSS